MPGDAARGKRAFTSRGCSNCHGLKESLLPGVKPVSQWESLADPVALTEAMWNHAPMMMAEARLQQNPWPALTAQELTDILVYLRNQPFPPSRPPTFLIGSGSDGEAVFRARGCASCHPSVPDLLPPALAGKEPVDGGRGFDVESRTDYVESRRDAGEVRAG